VRDGKCACGNANCRSPAKHPRTRNGCKDSTAELAQIERWWRHSPGANIGIATGGGLIVIDVDGPGGEAALQALQGEHGPLPETATVKTSRGRHLYFRTPKDRHISCSAGGGLDVRGDGGFVVAPFSQHISGHVYEWIGRTTKWAEAPGWLLDWARNRKGTARPIDDKMSGLGELPAYLQNIISPAISDHLEAALRTAWSPTEQARLEAALAAIDVKSCGYDDFLKIGFALHSLNWDRADGTSIGFDLWDRWCSLSDHYNQAGLEAKWQSFQRSARSGVTVGTVFHMARERGWNGPSPEPVNGQPSATILEAASLFAAAGGPVAALKTVSADALLSKPAPSRTWLVDRFIPAAEVTMIGGDGGTGKTTLALQLGMSCVSGDSWLDLPVNRMQCNLRQRRRSRTRSTLPIRANH
jgi:Bifunctional DNA primase/polymerase, N-terminal/Primase C terminal 2 (PriCT-2)/AAA domain